MGIIKKLSNILMFIFKGKTSSSDELTRFIFSHNWFSLLNNRVKYSAFIPPSNKRLSVFCVSTLMESTIWGIGNNLREATLLGRADIEESSILDVKLCIEKDNNPQYHANIIGWPDEKSEIKLKAMELATKARLHIHPARIQ